MDSKTSELDNHIIRLISKICHFIVKEQDGSYVDWGPYFDCFGFHDVFINNYRVDRSQKFGDSDYLSSLTAALTDAYQINPDDARLLMKDMIISGIKPSEDTLKDNIIIKKFIEDISDQDLTTLFSGITSSSRYLDINTVPDPFYEEIIKIINQSYQFQIYSAVEIFSRKIIENLIIDILRKQYKGTKPELYFDKNHGKFWPFYKLIHNFKDQLNTFHSILPDIDTAFIDSINEFREIGNAAAHNLEFQSVKGDIDSNKEMLKEVVSRLIRLYNNI